MSPDAADDVPEEPDDAAPYPAAGSPHGDDRQALSVLDRAGIDVFVPDGEALAAALGRTTDIGIGAHPDDLELLMVVPIAACLGRPDRWFTGVTATGGAGSVRSGRFAGLTDDELVAVRRDEQRSAAARGRYGAMVQLGHPTPVVRSADGRNQLVAELEALLRLTRPVNVYTHNLVDKHGTHVAVGGAVVEAARRLPPAERPWRVVGVEGWRDLDWLDDDEKVRLDATGCAELARDLAACHASQIEGGKRYDLAVEGRQRANATFDDPRRADDAQQVVHAMDLTPLVRNDDIDPVDFVRAAIERFAAGAEDVLRAALRPG